MNSDNHLYDCWHGLLTTVRTHYACATASLYKMSRLLEQLYRCFRFGFGSHSLSAYNIVE